MKELRYVNQLGTRNKATRLLWGMVYRLMFRPTPRWALHGWRRFLLRAFGAQIGTGCRIDPAARIWLPANLRLGDYVAIGEGADIYCVAPISIGDKGAISQRAFLCTASHDITDLRRPLTHAPIHIENHAWIAAEAMVFPGAQIGEGAVIAARAVFQGDAAPWTIYAGNPASKVGTRRLAETETDQPLEEAL